MMDNTSSSPPESRVDIIDSTPLLANSNSNDRNNNNNNRGFGRRPSLRGAARFLRTASSRRMMREPSVLVRERAAEQLEERQSDWAYSKPVVFLDIIWNLAFVIVAIGVLISSRNESSVMPLRLWILGYALQCVLHMVFVCMEYRRRHRSSSSSSSPLEAQTLQNNSGVLENGNGNESSESSSSSSREDSGDYPGERQEGEENSSESIAKHLESANTMFSFIWWIIGFYWVSAAGPELTRDAPQLYWLCIVFLAFDVFFVVFCVALACVIGIAVCCFLPCIIAILYAVAEQEGASKEDIDQLPKYKFRKIGDFEKVNGEVQGPFGGIMTECDTDSPIEHVLQQENAECCICLSAYDDGAELRELPCGHHFHCACIDKWLYINATCPLCKYNIIKNGNMTREEV
ncbi:hypothetical protein AQUCO_01300393v1 [Aquilegia coerulea]|uniref:RING-type E3 ubiquitin transferase n=1 Tax=Aquilegia coerulea TaxID=218851 RepID=A0A2G5E1F2_AQUCA|nr:hypothetical protein AQUCO_01300393v1 [Aquilegia coerulea]